jgi:hypothetical protein
MRWQTCQPRVLKRSRRSGLNERYVREWLGATIFGLFSVNLSN